jgi:hypothetical protein
MAKSPIARRIVVELNRPIKGDGNLDKYLTEANVLPWVELKSKFPHSLRAERMFTSVSGGKMREMINTAKKLDPGFQSLLELSKGRMVDLLACFFIRMPAAYDHEKLIQTLYEYPAVRLAYLDPDITVASVGYDPLFPQQKYLHAAPTGIEVEAAWPNGAARGMPGGDGEGARFIDVEYGWALSEPELLDGKNIERVALIGNPPGWNSTNPTLCTHGTQTLAVILALDNGADGNGVAPHVTTANVVSVLNPDREENRKDAIIYAAEQLGRGDVLVLPLQISGEGLPLESREAEFAAIRLATAKGITVVEAAGNGGEDLDVPGTSSSVESRRVLQRGEPGFEDSGAVMVGACKSKRSAGKYMRYSGSNCGSRVDCFAWGENVITLKRSTYSGTSAACAIVAGAAIIIQGIMRKKGSPGLGPTELRNALLTGGTPCASNEKIGVMPNLKAILPALP